MSTWNNSDCLPLSIDCACHNEYIFYDDFENGLLGLIVLPILIFGICSNVISVKIFTHKIMRISSINWHLTILSVSDTVILIAAFFVLTLPRIGEIFHIFGATRVSYLATPFMALMVLAQTVSVYMTVLMSVHRFIGVCFPFNAGRVLSRSRVKLAIGCVLLAALLFNTTRFFEVRVVNSCFRTNIAVTIPVLMPTSLRGDFTYRQLFFGWAYTIFMFALPFIVLIVVNSMVIMAVHRSRRLHAVLSGIDDVTKRQELSKEIMTSVMLVAIVIVFLLCNTLAFVVNILENVEFTGELYSDLVTWSNLLVVINASIDIVIYCLFSDKYRLLLNHYSRCLWRTDHAVLLTTTTFH